jgi:5-methylcytosine-specific restriction enzyme subunit McrC
VLQWAEIFLLSHSFSPYKGKEVAFALLFDMNLLFESYIGHLLKKRDLDVSLQDHEHHLAYLDNNEGKFQLKPDFVIRHDDEVIIADTKWKLLSEEKSHQGVNQADMYQLFAYGNKYNAPQCKNMYLIYPKSEDGLQEYQYYYEKELNGLQLKILFFDLSVDADNSSFYDSFKKRVR